MTAPTRSGHPRIGARIRGRGLYSTERSLKCDVVLRDLVAENQGKILAKARARAATRSTPLGMDGARTRGLPALPDQVGSLRKWKLHEAVDNADTKDSAGHQGDHLFHQGLMLPPLLARGGVMARDLTLPFSRSNGRPAQGNG